MVNVCQQIKVATKLRVQSLKYLMIDDSALNIKYPLERINWLFSFFWSRKQLYWTLLFSFLYLQSLPDFSLQAFSLPPFSTFQFTFDILAGPGPSCCPCSSEEQARQSILSQFDCHCGYNDCCFWWFDDTRSTRDIQLIESMSDEWLTFPLSGY